MSRARNVCPANGVCGQIQKTVIESEIGNERALADSVKCTAGAPLARRVCNNFSLSALHICPWFHQSACLRFSVASPQISLPPPLSFVVSSVLSFLSILSTLKLSGLGMLKQNCGFINKSKAAQASTLHMSSGRHTKAVMYKSSSHSFCKQKDGQVAEANSHVLSSEENRAERRELNCKVC